MKVILRADRKGLGKRGDIVEVSDGHARNFLLPKGHALRPPTVRSPRPASMRRARDLRDAAGSRQRADHRHGAGAKIITISAKSGAGRQALRLGHRGRRRSRRSRSRPTSSSTASSSTWSRSSRSASTR